MRLSDRVHHRPQLPMSLTTRITLLAIIAAALWVIAVEAAHAAPADGQMWEEIHIAEDYWRGDPNFGKCSEVAMITWWLPPGYYGWSKWGTCSAQISSRLARLARRGGVMREYWLETECVTVVHEYGHAIGWLPPSDDTAKGDPYHTRSEGVMNATVSAGRPVLRACTEFARKIADRYSPVPRSKRLKPDRWIPRRKRDR